MTPGNEYFQIHARQKSFFVRDIFRMTFFIAPIFKKRE